MSPRLAQAVVALIGLAYFLLAAVSLFAFPSLGSSPVRWGIAVPLIAGGLLNFACLPGFLREKLPDDAPFRPLDANGRAVVGSAKIYEIALALEEELRGTPHEIETSPDALRVSYDSGWFRQPVTGVARRLDWRSTLVPTRDPKIFVQLDQQLDRERGDSWSRATATFGWTTGARVQMTVDLRGQDRGKVEKSRVSKGDVNSAIKTALASAGARRATPAVAKIGGANAVVGVLVAVGAAVVAVIA